MGKAIMFMLFMWIAVSIAGGVSQGSVQVAATSLTIAIDDDDTTITVTSTEGFPDTGFIVIGDERIGYASVTDTTFKGNLAQPVVRGASDTTATDHAIGAVVRTVEGNMLNQSLGYKLAVISDASGLQAFVTMPWMFITLLSSFFVLPLGFLGTDLEILTYIWAALSIGIIVAMGIQLAGGRRV